MPISLPVDDEANELLARNALALLIAMLLDQRVPSERARTGCLVALAGGPRPQPAPEAGRRTPIVATEFSKLTF